MGQICKWAVVACAMGPQAPPLPKGPSERKEKRRNLGKIYKNRSKKRKRQGKREKKKEKRTNSQESSPTQIQLL